jgi:hypothetical protein
LEHGVRAAVRRPAAVVVVVRDEMGSRRWPETARDGMLAAPPLAPHRHHAGPTARQQRISGARNALSGQGNSWDHSRVGREPLGAVYRPLDQIDADGRRVDVVQDTWSIHHHADVQATWRQVPRVEPVGLPT